ncbi:MAG: hypothetical protein AAGD13_06315 [Pseudomonadota bacterium]
MPMKAGTSYFAIFGTMRTGSNLLEKTIEALGDTACFGEAFNPGFISGPRKTEVLGMTREQRDADPIGFLEHMIDADPDKISGFRIFNGHDRSVLNFSLDDPRCARIILRRDPLESYVSLQIARETDQWMLRNPKRRMTAKIHFDPVDFARYRSGLLAYYDAIETRLAASGLPVLRIDYEDLAYPDRLQQVAEHIGSSGTVPDEAPILRQNPMPMCEKVENYEEMCAAVGIEPVRAKLPALASPRDFLCPERIPVAYAPIAGPAFAPVIALLHRIESRHLSGCSELAQADLFDRARLGTLYPQGPANGRAVFTLITHPLVRAHAAFVDETCGPNWSHSTIRRALIRDHGPMPPPRGIQNGRGGYTPEQHRRHFLAFLDIIAEVISSDDESAPRPDWVAQARLVDLYEADGDRLRILRHEDFADLAHWLAELTGVAPLPPGQIKGLSQAEANRMLSLSDILDAEIASRVCDLHPEDYARFGYEHIPLAA